MTVKKENFDKTKTVKERYEELKEKIKQGDGYWNLWPELDQAKGIKDLSYKPIYGYRFVSKSEAVFSEKYEDFGVDKYFNYLFYLRDLKKGNSESEILDDMRNNLAFLELHLGKAKEVVSYLQKDGYTVIEHTSANALSHPYADLHFRLFICYKEEEIKYVASSVYAGRLEQLERVLQKCQIKPESIKHLDHRLNIRHEYERIFKSLAIDDKLVTLVVGARHGIATIYRLNKLFASISKEMSESSLSELDKKIEQMKNLLPNPLKEKLNEYLTRHGKNIDLFRNCLLTEIEKTENLSSEDKKMIVHFLKTYQFGQYYKALKEEKTEKLYRPINLRLVAEFDEWIEKMQVAYPEIKIFESYRIIDPKEIINGVYDSDFGRFDIIDLENNKKCVLVSIPYGENVVYLVETAVGAGARKILLTGSVGGFSYQDMPLFVGNLVAPIDFVDRGGYKKRSVKNIFSQTANVIDNGLHCLVNDITEEDEMWILDRLEEKINTVDVEVGLMPFTTQFGSQESNIEIGILGVVTDIVNKDNFHKLQTEIEIKEKIAQAFSKRDFLVLQEIKKVSEKFTSKTDKQPSLPKEINEIEDLRKRKIIAEHFAKLARRVGPDDAQRLKSVLIEIAEEYYFKEILEEKLIKITTERQRHWLTKLLNSEAAERIYETIRKEEKIRAIAVVRMDADSFRQINQLSYQAKNEMLAEIGKYLRKAKFEIAELLNGSIRQTDILHISGDEFGLILADIKPYYDDQEKRLLNEEEVVEKVLKRLVGVVEKIKRPKGVFGDFQTLSVGYKIVKANDDLDFAEANQLADQALKVSKWLQFAETKSGKDLTMCSERIVNYNKKEQVAELLGISKKEIAAAKIKQEMEKILEEAKANLDSKETKLLDEKFEELLEIFYKE